MSPYDQIIAELKDEFPKFKLVEKKDSLLMKALNIFLKVITFGLMKTFMTNFTTTVGYTIYTPSRWNILDRVGILKHERVHMRQMRRYGRIWFSLSYTFLWFPTVFAYFRKKYEQEAYETSMLHSAQSYGIKYIEDPKYRERMIARFTTAQYFWTWPWRKSLETWFDEALQRVRKKMGIVAPA